MKIKNLMAGDWMQHANGAYYQVARIDKLHDGSINFACGIPHLWNYNNKFEPIPLTPEILEKNGFHFGYTPDEEDMAHSVGASLDPDSKGWVYDEGAGAVKVQFPTESDGGQVYLYGDSYMTMVFDEVIYVHQLQHLINSCGIDKEIIL